jgi:predicted secreted protein
MSIAIPAIGTKLYRGDGNATNAVAASKTIGTSNQLLKIESKKIGTLGNSDTFGIVVSGNNTAFSIVVTANSVLINSATDGSAVATTTVDHAIAALYQNATFRENFIATTSGNGSGVLVAGASAALTGGTDNAEVFTLVPGVLDLAGPNESQDMIDVTSQDSTNQYREKLPGLRDGGKITGDMNWLPSNAVHQGMREDFSNQTLRNWKILFRDNSYAIVSAYVESLEVTAGIGNQLKRSFTLDISGEPEFTYSA